MGACSPMESQAVATGSSYYSAKRPESGKESSLHRTPSVDDLFAPLWRLEVQQQQNLHDFNADARRMSSVLQSMDPTPIGSPATGREKTPASTSASDEEQLLEDKKQKRMLSNRESARRSRLRKQQHLEDLRSQLLELRGQNSQIMGKLTAASQQFQQLNHDNELLRMHAIDLSRQLQGLHQQATAIHPDGLQAFGFGSSHLDPPGVALGSSTSAYSIVSDVLQGSL